MNGAEVRILEQMHQEGLGAFLQRLDGLRLPAHAFAADGDEVEGDFADLARGKAGEVSAGGRGGDGGDGGAYEAGEREFQEQEVRGALVTADFAEGDRAGAVAAGFAGDGVAGWGTVLVPCEIARVRSSRTLCSSLLPPVQSGATLGVEWSGSGLCKRIQLSSWRVFLAGVWEEERATHAVRSHLFSVLSSGSLCFPSAAVLFWCCCAPRRRISGLWPLWV